jgi:hypothetical protein
MPNPAPAVVRLAMWSEPFYAHYLKATGIEHPGREEILATHESDAATVANALIGPVPGGRRLWYQKHMSHHLLPGMDDLVPGWLDRLTHAFLVRDPARVIVSFAKVVANPTPEDLGLPQQLRLLERLRAQGLRPPVVDAAEIRGDPRGSLTRLCGAVGIAFDEAMLGWPAGPRETDGVWAKHWYASVERSTGFEPPEEGEPPEVPSDLRGVLAECRAIYEAIRAA